MKILFILFVIAHSVFSLYFSPVIASDRVQTARYTQITLAPTREMKHPLDVVINVQLPRNINVIGEAMGYLLTRSGYELTSPAADENNEALYVLLTLPLPLHQRKMGTLRLKTALETLAGAAYQMQVNPVTRKIGFTLKDNYRAALASIDLKPYKTRWQARKLKGIDRQVTVDTANQAAAFPDVQKTSRSQSDKTYGPIALGETLSEIVQKLKYSGVSNSQLMASIFTLNKQAFIGNNIHAMKAGEILRIPANTFSSEESAQSMLAQDGIEK